MPWASALRHGSLPEAWEQARLELVARRSDGNREFARLLELCLSHPQETVETALALAREQREWIADTVRHLLQRITEPGASPPPLDAERYPAYQAPQPIPDLQVYNRLLEVRP